VSPEAHFVPALAAPACLPWKYRHDQAHEEGRLTPRGTPAVKKMKGNHKSCGQAPYSPNPERNLENKEGVLLQNTKLAHTAVGPQEVHVQRGRHPGLQLLV